MPEYSYEALTAGGAVTRGSVAAETESEVEALLREQGSYLIRASRVTAGAEAAEAASAAAEKVTDARIPRGELLGLTEYLWTSTQAGIPLLETLTDVEPRLQSRRLRRIIAEIRRAMSERGLSLSEAMARHPKAFSGLYVGTIEAGETSGHLDYALQQLAEYLEWQEKITTQMREATRYPLIVLTGVGLLMLGLITFVYPRIVPLLVDFDVELPWSTRFLMGTATFLREQWAMLLVGLVGTVIGGKLIVRTTSGRWLRDRIALRLPLFGEMIRRVDMARFVTYLALFYRTGVDLVHGLSLVERMMGNRVVAAAVGRARREIVDGASMADAFGRTRLFPMIVLRSIALGEKTGSLDEALSRVKAYYDREIPAAVNRMTASLQPLLIVVLGAVLLLIAFSIFMPLIGIYNSIGP